MVPKELQDSRGWLQFSKLKYNLDELFERTPVFEVPPLRFSNDEEDNKVNIVSNGDYVKIYKKGCSWKGFKDIILNGNNSNKALVYLKEFRNNQMFSQVKKPNIPFYYIKRTNISNLRKYVKQLKERLSKNKLQLSQIDYSNIIKDINTEETSNGESSRKNADT